MTSNPHYGIFSPSAFFKFCEFPVKKTNKKPISKKGRYSAYDSFLASIPPRSMTKRPKYLHGIGVFRGLRGDTIWIKILFRHGGLYKNIYYKPGSSLEIKLGKRESYSWADAEAALQEYQGKADRNEPLEAVAVPLFKTYAEDWLESHKTRSGYKTAKGILENHLYLDFGNLPLNAITVKLINTWQTQQNKKYKPGSVKRQKNVLKAILNRAMSEQYLTVNPCNNTPSIKVPDTIPRFLTPEELLALLIEAEKQANWLPDYMLFGIHTGMRRGEIANLKWSQVIQAPTGAVCLSFASGKTQKIRTIACGPTLKEILNRQKQRKIADDDRVFPIALITLRRKWEKARIAAKLPDITIQNMRSTNATYAAMSGVDLRTLAGRLGHKDLTMLQKYYAALTNNAEVEASNKIDFTFSQALEQAKVSAATNEAVSVTIN